MTVRVKDGYLYVITTDNIEAPEKHSERSWFVVSQKPKSHNEYSHAVIYSKIYVNNKYDGCIYNNEVIKELEEMKNNIFV